ncbi:MAG: DNA replication/repair protein RecF [Chloroflexi bacterium]|nr:DNA replication/repair protein RecF [Chloroflexota bacterium]
MRLEHLSLSNFRNYGRLELQLPAEPLVNVFAGNNAQGKSNLLEAVYYLATTKSLRASSEREVVNWAALNEPASFMRVSGKVQRSRGPVQIEVALRLDPQAARADGAPSLAKRIRVNGVVRRAIDAVGQVNAILFGPEDVALVTGTPQLRRRYFDVTISQLDSWYVRTLSHYNRVILQRNHLLRLIRERRTRPDQLPFWDDELIRDATYLVEQRARIVRELNERVETTHRRLTGQNEHFGLEYRSSFELPLELSAASLAASLREQLQRIQPRELAQGVSLLGPHRDDYSFLVGGIDMNAFGSRGQQRTVALALKLAETELVRAHTGEQPILLLDDVFSELDNRRREHVLATIDPDQQVLFTTTDPAQLTPEFRAAARTFGIDTGTVFEMGWPKGPIETY